MKGPNLGYAIDLNNQLFAEGAFGTVGSGKYTSLGGQRLIINPAKDPKLQYFLQQADQYLAQNRTNNSISRAELLNKFVNESLRYADPEADYLAATRLRQELYSSGKPVKLGEFADARAGVCREYGACLHVALADAGKQNYMVVGDVVSVEGKYSNQDAGRHAWVEFIDSRTGQWMVADPTNSWLMPRDKAYIDMFLGVSNVQRQVFVWPEGTPFWQRVTGQITP